METGKKFVFKQGYLLKAKRHPKIKRKGTQFKKRFFQLRNSYLFWYKSEKKSRVHGFIEINASTTIHPLESNSKRLQFENPSFCIEGSSKDDVAEWCNVLLDIISECRRQAGLDTIEPLDPIILDDMLQSPDLRVRTVLMLLQKHKHESEQVSKIANKMLKMAESDENMAEFDFYRPQIVEISLYIQPMCEDLNSAVLKICHKSPFFALHTFWTVEASWEDATTEIQKERCAAMLRRVESSVVNDDTVDAALKGDYRYIRKASQIRSSLSKDDLSLTESEESVLPYASSLPFSPLDVEDPSVGHHRRPSDTEHAMPSPDSHERKKLLNWVELERKARYNLFHNQRRFVKELTDMTQTMWEVRDVPSRQPALKEFLGSYEAPPGAMVPLAATNFSYQKILRPLPHLSRVFSTHSRCPCLVCFEVADAGDEASSLMKANVAKKEICDWEASYDAALVRDIVHKRTSMISSSKRKSKSSPSKPKNPLRQPGGIQGSFRRSNKSPEKRAMKVEGVEAKERFEESTCSAFGVSWKDRILKEKLSSELSKEPGWDVVSMFAKSNDDIRQEAFTIQLFEYLQRIFDEHNLPLKLRTYKIISTGKWTGLLETITDTESLDHIKKTEGYVSLADFFENSYASETDENALENARMNFIESMAAYSIACYVLQIKDRHNANILLDNVGRIIHIDFGFMLGIAPGGKFSFETTACKLTEEMVDVMGGIGSEGYMLYQRLCVHAMLAIRQHAQELLTMIDIQMDSGVEFPCFSIGKKKVLKHFRKRLQLHMSTQELTSHVIDLIEKSYNNFWTKQYDVFQRLTNGIAV